jgi:SNF2 family DNA or RNA helicase
MQQMTGNHQVILRGHTIETLTETTLAQLSGRYVEANEQAGIIPVSLMLNQGSFTRQPSIPFPVVTIVQDEQQLLVDCDCATTTGSLCEHGAQVLLAILRNENFSAFFNQKIRTAKLRQYAKDYGLENEPDLDRFFHIEYGHNKLSITPALPSLVPVTTDSLQAMQSLVNVEAEAPAQTDSTIAVILKKHKYNKYLIVELYHGDKAKNGQLKNPLTPAPPLDFIWQSDDPDHVKFFTAIHKFQGHSDGKRKESDIKALRAIVKNPAGYDFYYHLAEVSDNITASSVAPIKPALFTGDMVVTVEQRERFYEIGGSLTISGIVYDLKDMAPLFTYFILAGDTLYLIDKPEILGITDLLKNKSGNLLVHASKYREFKHRVLQPLEDKIRVDYRYIDTASVQQLEEQGFNNEPEKIIYLSDFGNYIMLIPVIRYSEVEIPIRTKRQVYGLDEKGKEFLVQRDDKLEIEMMSILLRQHPYFEEQLETELHYFYLHRKHFMAEQWFLEVFEAWTRQGITILGFNELEGNKLNPYKAKVDIKVHSGINWFNAEVQVKFGKKKATLKHIYKSIRDRSKYVPLDDGTLGILPQEWMDRFEAYLNAGDIIDMNTVRIAKINFSTVEQLFDKEMLGELVVRELDMYKHKVYDFEAIKEVEVPAALNATLRPYQKAGLNWLHFLDEFRFGGVLADDMGLGKSIQVIAFILSQRDKGRQNTNLIIVPATLIFNWQAEIAKFAPSLKLRTIYGADRVKNTEGFDQYEVLLTSYGTLISDIQVMKEYTFNYIFLDESQNIKNPETQRYKAVCLLQAHNRIAVTGTPVENNTFDLFSQLSFACPGLLGNKQYFRDVYAIPIDQFKSSKRAKELQQKIAPFVLRRTKQQVAAELPEKTEMVLYCEMGETQRRLYDAQEKEFREYVSAIDGDELKKNQLNVLKSLTRLRQICDAPALLGTDKYSREHAVKITQLMEQIEEKSPNHKILVFSQFVSMLDLLQRELMERGIGYALLTGSTRNREAAVNTFQNNADCRVFLISLKAGGTGLNLTEADYVYLVDPWWNPAVENQAIDRAHRIGQDKKVIAIRMICKDTLEEKMMLMQESKRELSQNLVRADAGPAGSLTKEELLSLL